MGATEKVTIVEGWATLRVSLAERMTPGFSTHRMQPVVSAIAPSVFPGYPTVTERRTLSTVRVRNGETLVIGASPEVLVRKEGEHVEVPGRSPV